MPYYTLRLHGHFSNLRSGDTLQNANNPLTIGTTADSDIRLPLDPRTPLPQYFATILPCKDGQGWLIVRRNDSAPISIAGKAPLAHACQLNDGDVIQFGPDGQELTFRIHSDNKYTAADITTIPHSHNAIIYTASLTLIALLAILLVWRANSRPAALDLHDVAARCLPSVCMIKVDSVAWITILPDGSQQTLAVSIPQAQDPVIGSAFLTDDGRLVTARHCIEYWIAEPLRLDTRIADLPDDDIVRWAAEAETFNFEHPDPSSPRQQLRSYCSVYPANATTGKPLFSFTSTDSIVTMDKSRDALIPLDDFSRCYYWRTTTPYFNRRDMELGDWATVKAPLKGNLKLATVDILNSLSSNTPVAFIGMIENERTPLSAETVGGNILIWNPDHIGDEDIVHSANITHGFSGGPVIASHHGNYWVIGIVSRVDKVNDGLTMSVPITEIITSPKQSQQ